ncbi:MAG: Spy/CpxP family protein refolding chaperone [Candidatus Omnitrophota bacterium]|jgi:Spy/CpxP family protein refolding chaperone
MIKIKQMIVCLLTAFTLMSAAYAADNPTQTKPVREKSREQFSKELNLTPEQQSKLTENRKAQRKNLAQLRKAVKENEAKLREALKVPGVTKSSVQPIANEIKSLQAQLIDSRIESILAVRQILTPEQVVKFDQMADKYRKNRGDRVKGRGERQKCNDKVQ